MSELIDTTEMYLRTIFELQEEGVVPRRARIAERLGHSGPTVSQTIARMSRDGLVEVTGERHLELTSVGLERATRVMRRHRLAELLLLHVLGLELESVHEEACRLEHVLTDRVERRILALVPDATHSPFGNPIPGLGQLRTAPSAPSEAFEDAVTLASAVDQARDFRITIRRFGEPAQVDPQLLAALNQAGIAPGKACRAWLPRDTETAVAEGTQPLPDDLVVRLDQRNAEAVRVSAELAEHIFVNVAS